LVAAAAACAIIPVSRQSGETWDGGAHDGGPKLHFLADYAEGDGKPRRQKNENGLFPCWRSHFALS
jgi:hypothetical protein